MCCDFAKELVAPHDLIFETAAQKLMVRVARIPDSCLAHQVEPGLVRDYRSLTLGVCAKKYRGTEHALKGGNQSSILRTALLHTEEIQHLGCATKCDGRLLLSHCSDASLSAEITPPAWKRYRAPTLLPYDGEPSSPPKSATGNKDERTVTTAFLKPDTENGLNNRGDQKDRHVRISSWPGEIIYTHRPDTFAQTCLLAQP